MCVKILQSEVCVCIFLISTLQLVYQRYIFISSVCLSDCSSSFILCFCIFQLPMTTSNALNPSVHRKISLFFIFSTLCHFNLPVSSFRISKERQIFNLKIKSTRKLGSAEKLSNFLKK